MTQKELAARTGISVKLISAYENDRVQPRKGNRQLLLEALDGTSPEESGGPAVGGTKPDGDAEVHEQADANAAVETWCTFCGQVARLVRSREAQILVSWTDEIGALAAIAVAHDDNRLLTIRASIVPATIDDVRSLRALVDRLAEQLRGSAP